MIQLHCSGVCFEQQGSFQWAGGEMEQSYLYWSPVTGSDIYEEQLGQRN